VSLFESGVDTFMTMQITSRHTKSQAVNNSVTLRTVAHEPA